MSLRRFVFKNETLRIQEFAFVCKNLKLMARGNFRFMISSKIIEDGRFWTVCYARDDDVEQVGVGRAEPCEKAGPPSMIQVRFSSCDQIWLDLSLDGNDILTNVLI